MSDLWVTVGIPTKTQNQMEIRSAGATRMIDCEIFLSGGAVHRSSRGYRNTCTRTSFSRLRFGADDKSGRKIKEAQYFYSLPKLPRLRRLFENQNNKGSLQKAHWRSSTTSKEVWWFITADHKVVNEECESRNNHRYAVVVQDLATQGFSLICVKTKLHSKQKKLAEVPRVIRKAKGHLHWQFFGIIGRQHLINLRQVELQNELCVEQEKRHQPYCCNLDRMIRGGLILWNAIAICETFKTS